MIELLPSAASPGSSKSRARNGSTAAKKAELLNTLPAYTELPRIRFHDLRHTAATILLADGENLKAVQERLGHAAAAMTLDVYGHVLPGFQRAVAERLDEFFGT